MLAQYHACVHLTAEPYSMRVTTATALRANFVLFSISIGIAIVPCLSAATLFGLLDNGMPSLSCEGGTFLLASLIMLLLRWYARRAFDAAVEANKVQLPEEPGLEASIAHDCPRAWLVQLHLELYGQHVD